MDNFHLSHRINRADRIHRMVRLALIHPFLNFHEVDLNRTPVREWRQFERSDPFVDLNGREFKLQYRFLKQSVLRLVSELSPYLVDDKRKHCLSPLQLPLPHLELMLDFAHFWLGGRGGHRIPSIRN